jgi:hypothetical protein
MNSSASAWIPIAAAQTRARITAADAEDGSQNRTLLSRSMMAVKSLFISR